ncbi:hypothetical protein BRADI_2g46662v3 [Brachypodium distachyon]|uniref:Uncharacterized protein n=1 Tax=Brachypodium distachyon TaxID=15368 RepID=A0A2K2DE88_BRADI|nr:hypothetical protein BRADI_2g46662v3 [Brachypodium distachyon]
MAGLFLAVQRPFSQQDGDPVTQPLPGTRPDRKQQDDRCGRSPHQLYGHVTPISRSRHARGITWCPHEPTVYLWIIPDLSHFCSFSSKIVLRELRPLCILLRKGEENVVQLPPEGWSILYLRDPEAAVRLSPLRTGSKLLRRQREAYPTPFRTR